MDDKRLQKELKFVKEAGAEQAADSDDKASASNKAYDERRTQRL